MSPMKRYATQQAQARKRRRRKAQERLQHQRAQAQRSIEALHQALKDVDFSETLVAEIEGRLQAPHHLLGQIVGLMFPTLFDCRHHHELTRVRGWNQNIPSQRSYSFTLEDGRKVKGSDLVKPDNWAWQQSLHAPGCRYVRLRARSQTYGEGVLIGVDKLSEKPFYLISMSLTLPPSRG